MDEYEPHINVEIGSCEHGIPAGTPCDDCNLAMLYQCPSCARYAAKKKDREGIARFLFYVRWPAPENNWDRHAVKDTWYKKADEFLLWMEE